MQFAVPLAPDPVSFECDPHCIEQVLSAERLGQKFDGTRPHRPDRHWDIAMTGNEDDRDIDVSGSELGLNVESARSRQPHVKDETADSVGWLAVEELLGARENLAAKAH